jgi:hypothetical protein
VQSLAPAHDPCEVFADGLRQHDGPVLSALALADGDLVASEIHVLDADAAALQDAEAGAVHQAGQEAVRLAGVDGVHGVEQGGDLGQGEDDGDVAGAVGADGVEVAEVDLQDVAVQGEDGRERLVLRAGGDVAMHGEMGEEGFDVGPGQVFGVAPAVRVRWKRMNCSIQLR